MKSIVTNYNNLCAICGKPSSDQHHLVFGAGLRTLAEEDGLKIPICRTCHTSSLLMVSRIHDNSAAETLSKISGQLAWERRYIANGVAEIAQSVGCKDITAETLEAEARSRFRERYGRSYL